MASQGMVFDPGTTGGAGTMPSPAAGSTSTLALTSAVGTGLQLVGQIYSAIQASKMGAYNAAVAQANAQAEAQQFQHTALQQERLAQIAAYDIQLSQEAAAFRAARLREQFAQIQGVAEARIGASGLLMSGSPLAILEANAQRAEMAILVSNYEAKLEQQALQEARRQHQYGAVLARFGATERLRLGTQQMGLSQYEAGQTMFGNVLGAVGTLNTGYQRYQTARTQDKVLKAGGPTLFSSLDRSPSSTAQSW